MPRASRDPRAETPTALRLNRTAYERIRAAIVYGRLDFGEPLSETELARALGVSKGPIRSALVELQVKGLVEIVPQSGTYVFSATPEEIEQLGDFRFLLESEAIRLSMEHAASTVIKDLRRIVASMTKAGAAGNRLQTKLLDTQFHEVFITNCRNSYLQASYETIGHTIDALRYRVLDTIVYRNRALEEHERMADLLEQGEIAKAIAILRAHIERTKRFQASVDWGGRRARRKDYRFRNYKEALEG